MNEANKKRLSATLLALRPSIPPADGWFNDRCHFNIGVSLSRIRDAVIASIEPDERATFEQAVPSLQFRIPKSKHPSDPNTVENREARRLYAQLEAYLSATAGTPSASASQKKVARNNPTGVRVQRKVFIVHGHDEAARDVVARFVERLGFTAVILHEQANAGSTVIEKLERHSDVEFAIILLTPDDEGRVVGADHLVKRARQNVILELGYFLGVLKRQRVCALYKGDVEIPSDYLGVLFVPLDSTGGWRERLAREMREAGLEIDLNKI